MVLQESTGFSYFFIPCPSGCSPENIEAKQTGVLEGKTLCTGNLTKPDFSSFLNSAGNFATIARPIASGAKISIFFTPPGGKRSRTRASAGAAPASRQRSAVLKAVRTVPATEVMQYSLIFYKPERGSRTF